MPDFIIKEKELLANPELQNFIQVAEKVRENKNFKAAVMETEFRALSLELIRDVFYERNKSAVPILSKEAVDQMDILTKQSMSTYPVNIEPLLSNSNFKRTIN